MLRTECYLRYQQYQESMMLYCYKVATGWLSLALPANGHGDSLWQNPTMQMLHRLAATQVWHDKRRTVGDVKL